jgi:hypothetical protein
MLTMLGGIAQFEREIMLEWQREGIAKAKSEGKYKGRKPTASAETGTEGRRNHCCQLFLLAISTATQVLGNRNGHCIYNVLCLHRCTNSSCNAIKKYMKTPYICRDLSELKDFLLSTAMRAPDNLRPNINLDQSFAIIEDAIGRCGDEIADAEKEHHVRSLVAAAYDAYARGDKIRGAHSLQEAVETLGPLPDYDS